jgi:hypothetical protein
MHRRSAVSRLAATMAGLSLGEVPELDPAAPLLDEPFSVTRGNLAESCGTVTCPMCQEMGDALDLTPAGPCLRCADRDPALRAEPHSDPFWILSPREIRRLEPEIQRLASELDRMNDRLLELWERQIGEASEVYDRAMGAARDEWNALQRELHLLHLLRAASRQFGS